ncbi:MAG: hypothetical protein GXN91_04845 [Epsilonproteobacteria bacterium]|nr:hypothetical protein [Campylobacterota bacterium]
MIREFFIVVIFIAVLFLIVIVDYIKFDNSKIASLNNSISKLTKLPLLSLNVAFYENDSLYYQNFKKRLNYYPNLFLNLDKIDFIYKMDFENEK